MHLEDFFDLKKTQDHRYIRHDLNSTEYWVDLHNTSGQEIDNFIQEKKANKIVFYDIFHADFCMPDWWVPFVKKTSDKIPVEWITINKLPIEDFSTIHYDFYWNRCKSVHTNGPPGVRYKSYELTYKHHILNWNPRSHQYLSPVRSNTFRREDLLMFLKKYQGFYSNSKLHPCKHPDLEQAYLETDFDEDSVRTLAGLTIPVARHYYDNSYVSCQVESQYLTGGSIVFSEKTYDHLIQGRLVLNFGPQFYYRTLKQQGWQLWSEIDLSWDSIACDELRWKKYLKCLTNLFDLSMADLHDIFLSNRLSMEHNWQQLYDRPYDYID